MTEVEKLLAKMPEGRLRILRTGGDICVLVKGIPELASLLYAVVKEFQESDGTWISCTPGRPAGIKSRPEETV